MVVTIPAAPQPYCSVKSLRIGMSMSTSPGVTLVRR
jgi:hypothetical protein